MNWVARVIRVRKECTRACGVSEVMDVGVPPVLALVYRFRKAAMLTLHNFSDAAQTIHLGLATPAASAWWTCSARSTARPPAAARTIAPTATLPLVPRRHGRRNARAPLISRSFPRSGASPIPGQAPRQQRSHVALAVGDERDKHTDVLDVVDDPVA